MIEITFDIDRHFYTSYKGLTLSVYGLVVFCLFGCGLPGACVDSCRRIKCEFVLVLVDYSLS